MGSWVLTPKPPSKNAFLASCCVKEVKLIFKYARFCNYTRDQLKEQNQSLSFTELSKRSGEKWRSLSPRELETWKQRAAVPWQKFKADVVEYKKTEQYREYERYLADFKAGQAGKQSERKSSMSQQQSPVSSKRYMNYRTGPRSSPKRPDLDRRSTAPIPATQQNPVSLKRFKKDNEGWGDNQVTAHSTRGRQACESCRARKIKCYGEKPNCRHCRELGIDCQYGNGERGKKQR